MGGAAAAAPGQAWCALVLKLVWPEGCRAKGMREPYANASAMQEPLVPRFSPCLIPSIHPARVTIQRMHQARHAPL